MYLDGVLYVASFIVCVAVGPYISKINERNTRRDCGAFIGMVIALMVCGQYVFNCIAMVLVNILIMRYCDKQAVHKLSLIYTWSHLLLIHMFLSRHKYIIWYYQTLALRLVGLSFEMHIADCAKRNLPLISPMKVFPYNDENDVNPDPIDIIGYAFFFGGVHRGPYFRWNVLKNYLETPEPPNFRDKTESKVANIIAWTLAYLYLIISGKFTSDVYYDSSFYTERQSDYRYIYNISQLLTFYLQSQILANLSTCSFTECGFGGFLASTKPTPGHGPTTYTKPQTTSTSDNIIPQYSFDTITQIRTKSLILGPHLKDTLRSWNMPTRYFFWAYGYKNLIQAHKSVRSVMSYGLYFLWSGPTFGNALMGLTFWLHCHLEKECGLYFPVHDETIKGPKDWCYSVMRILCLVYLAPCFIINDTSVLSRYYNSIYWAYHCLLAVLVIVAIVVYKHARFIVRI